MSDSDRGFFGAMFLVFLASSGGSSAFHPIVALVFLAFAIFIGFVLAISFAIDKVKSWFRAKDFPEQHPHW